MIGIATGHYLGTLLDTKKGSLTNRHECGKEHFKNDVKLTAGLTVPAAAVAGAYLKPAQAKHVVGLAGTGAAKVMNVISKSINALFGKTKPGAKIATKLAEIATKVTSNPLKYGKIGVAILGAATLLGMITNHAEKRGQINQKYEDAAKIESQTKNVILEASKTAEPKYGEMAAVVA